MVMLHRPSGASGVLTSVGVRAGFIIIRFSTLHQRPSILSNGRSPWERILHWQGGNGQLPSVCQKCRVNFHSPCYLSAIYTRPIKISWCHLNLTVDFCGRLRSMPTSLWRAASRHLVASTRSYDHVTATNPSATPSLILQLHPPGN